MFIGWNCFCIGEGLNTWAQISNHGRACTQVLLLRKAELGFFHFLEIVTSWLVPSAGEKTQYSMVGTFPLAENRFLQASKLKIQRNLEPVLGGYQLSSHISICAQISKIQIEREHSDPNSLPSEEKWPIFLKKN
jgi:hypothetical protein